MTSRHSIWKPQVTKKKKSFTDAHYGGRKKPPENEKQFDMQYNDVKLGIMCCVMKDLRIGYMPVAGVGPLSIPKVRPTGYFLFGLYSICDYQ